MVAIKTPHAMYSNFISNMAPKSLSLLVVICSILLASASIEASLDGWQVIKNLRDPTVIDIAKFAVKEHNKIVDSMLELVSVVHGETQVVSGINYKLLILAKDDALEGNYRVVVWDKPWTKERNLTSFEKILKLN
ncbi:cysteine proteinase inhibitor 1-like [Henckelia pumila]|uniref:cysteine proteinase inhibitor 1-like n=1 Tax=Henckelia pumila TaxID=405737 RepID=UPI003C6DC8AE